MCNLFCGGYCTCAQMCPKLNLLQKFPHAPCQIRSWNSSGCGEFPVFLVEGVTRWNSSRAAAATESSQAEVFRSFHTCLKDKVNGLSQILHGRSAFPSHVPPSKHTGELFGVQYLYDQAGLPIFLRGESGQGNR